MKTYKLLDHTTPLPAEEIRRLYKGYWVFIVNATFDEYNALISGTPVVIGALAFDGVEDGIYKQYKSEEYGQRTDWNLLPNKSLVYCLQAMGAPDE
jgi:hypothetical protein